MTEAMPAQLKQRVVLARERVFNPPVTVEERASLLDDMANWPRVCWFEIPLTWGRQGDQVSLVVLGTDCDGATYLKLRYSAKPAYR